MPITRKQFKVIHNETDPDGNHFIVEQEPLYGNWKLYIHLHSEPKRRFIGEVDTQNAILFVMRDKARHYQRNMGAYGFNWRAIHRIGNLKFILMLEDLGYAKQYYLIPKKKLIAHGVKKNFSASDMELQIFLRQEFLELFKTPAHFTKGRMAH
jgi:hypothetical protein